MVSCGSMVLTGVGGITPIIERVSSIPSGLGRKQTPCFPMIELRVRLAHHEVTRTETGAATQLNNCHGFLCSRDGTSTLRTSSIPSQPLEFPRITLLGDW